MLTADIPEPVAFFPLTEGSGSTVASFPDAAYNGTLQGSMTYALATFSLCNFICQVGLKLGSHV